MPEFKFTIGMNTKTIMGNLNNFPKVTDKTKQFIINFCNNDADGMITNNIELSMLNAWSSGFEKVPMPEKRAKHNPKLAVEETYYPEETYQGEGNDRLKLIEFKDKLVDNDNDGFADERHCRLFRKTVTGYSASLYQHDFNMDGINDKPKSSGIHPKRL